VQRYAYNEEASFKVPEDEGTPEKTADDEEGIPAQPDGSANEVKAGGGNRDEPVFSFAKRLSCKWSTGNGPRIGCVRDYPLDLQSRALEHVNLSPRVTPGPLVYGPIPSPRPSPKVRVSPRLAYMGLPSPRTQVSSA